MASEVTEMREERRGMLTAGVGGMKAAEGSTVPLWVCV